MAKIKKLLNLPFLAFSICIFLFVVFVSSFVFQRTYLIENGSKVGKEMISGSSVLRVKTPNPVKTLYMTSWVAGTPSMRKKLVDLIGRTELNAVVIDIKDYSGKIAFLIKDKNLAEFGSYENRIADVESFIDLLHKKGIYVIGRISVFQDAFMVGKRPDLAVKKKSDKNAVWKDRKGISWIDPGAKEFWEYIKKIGEYSYAIGFDELNFDYIRFPSDGNMEDIYYPFSNGKDKVVVLQNFFAFIKKSFRDTGAVISADIFGMTTTNNDDLNIGQKIRIATAYFDYVAPMVYPSHYPPGFLNLENPAEHPYEVVKYSMDEAFKRASTTGEKLRPWLQDFDLGANYDAEKVRAQIRAVYDSGLKSWMLWSPSNVYTEGALER